MSSATRHRWAGATELADIRAPFRWFARNVRATSEPAPIPITLERNREAVIEMGAYNPPDVPLYRFRVGLRAGFSGDASAAIPVYKRVNPHPHPVLKEIFYCEVAGRELEAANVHAVREKVVRMLEGLAPAGSLPLAYFRVPASDFSLPVYEEGGKLVCPMIAGANLKGDDLASIRRNVCRYLINGGYVADASQIEINVVRPSDLKLVPPAAIIESQEDPDLWFASVEGHSPEGLVIGLLGEATELRPAERPRAGRQDLDSPPAASDVASLLRLVANGLAEQGRITDPSALYATHVRPAVWARTEQLTDDVGRSLVCWLEGDEPTRLELPLRRTAAGELLTALSDEGIAVFTGVDESALAARVGRYLSGSGFLRFQDAVEVEEPAGESEERTGMAWDSREIEFPRLEFGEAARPDEEVTLQ
jgi:hypothetical protein